MLRFVILNVGPAGSLGPEECVCACTRLVLYTTRVLTDARLLGLLCPVSIVYQAADIACSFVIQSVAEHGRWIPEELEIGSKQEHDAWMERNGSWAPPHQMLPYEELSREEKDKDRAIVLAAIDYLVCMFLQSICLLWCSLWNMPTSSLNYFLCMSLQKAKFYNDTIWADRSDPPSIDLEYLKNLSNGNTPGDSS